MKKHEEDLQPQGFMHRISKLLSKAKGRDVDMTVGSIPKNILMFAFPLMIGNLFQQLYNMVDTWVIGQTGEVGPFGAVGTVGPVINILIGFFTGLASGTGVVISHYYGAKNSAKVRETVHTALFITLILSILFTVLGVIGTPYILRLMFRSDSNMSTVYPYAKQYLTIYFWGVTSLLVYNMGAGILRAVGDSKRPFYFLLVSAVTNIILDLLFVNKFGMGVEGVALATVIAQTLSAVLTVVTLVRTDSVIKVELKRIKAYKGILGEIVRLGSPAALQMSLTAFSNVFVQSYVANASPMASAPIGGENYCLAGWTTYSKVDQFIFLPVQSISLGVTTFVGQCYGKGDRDRAKKGTRTAFLMALGITVAVISVVMLFTPQLAALFNDNSYVVEHAKLLMYNLTPFYILCCVNQVFAASLRGAGDATAPMFIMLGTFVGFRQLYLFVVSSYISNGILPIAFSYPAGWFLCAVTTLIYYTFFHLKKQYAAK